MYEKVYRMHQNTEITEICFEMILFFYIFAK